MVYGSQLLTILALFYKSKNEFLVNIGTSCQTITFISVSNPLHSLLHRFFQLSWRDFPLLI